MGFVTWALDACERALAIKQRWAVLQADADPAAAAARARSPAAFCDPSPGRRRGEPGAAEGFDSGFGCTSACWRKRAAVVRHSRRKSPGLAAATYPPSWKAKYDELAASRNDGHRRSHPKRWPLSYRTPRLQPPRDRRAAPAELQQHAQVGKTRQVGRTGRARRPQHAQQHAQAATRTIDH